MQSVEENIYTQWHVPKLSKFPGQYTLSTNIKQRKFTEVAVQISIKSALE